MSLRLLLLALPLLAVAVTGCSDARCDPGQLGEPWKAYASVLPDAAVVCGPNRHSEAKPSDVVDDYPPTHVFVFYEEKDPGAAFDATVAKFEGAGWKVAKVSAIGEGDHKIYDAEYEKDGVTIRATVNRNDWGTQGSFDLTLPES